MGNRIPANSQSNVSILLGYGVRYVPLSLHCCNELNFIRDTTKMSFPATYMLNLFDFDCGCELLE